MTERSLSIPIRQTTLTLKGMLPSSLNNGTTIVASTNPAKDWKNVLGVSTGKSIPAFPNTSVEGYPSTVQKGIYSASVAPGSFAYRIDRAGVSAVTLASFILSAGPAEDIRVSQIAFEMKQGAPALLIGQKVEVWTSDRKIGDVQFGLGSQPNLGVSTLLDTSMIIPGGTQTTVLVRGDISPDATLGSLLTIAYDGDRNGLEGNYGAGMSSGNFIPGTSPDQVPPLPPEPPRPPVAPVWPGIRLTVLPSTTSWTRKVNRKLSSRPVSKPMKPSLENLSRT